MDKPRAATDELDGLRQFLKALESGVMTIKRGNVDVTQQESELLNREIAHLETALARLKRGGGNA